jgi:hypothetical protein
LTKDSKVTTNKIFTFGDGFATGHIWPEWPQILQALLPDYQVINTAGIGAGTEFLVSGFADHVPHMKGSTVIFQWPYHNRFDKLIEDNSWQQIINTDPVYHFNTIVDCKNRKWWLSSASQGKEVQHYHQQYVQPQQHLNRDRVYCTLVDHTALALDCKIFHTSTHDQDQFSNHIRFAATRQSEVQPSPVVHFYWLIEQVLPQIGIVIDQTLQQQLEQLINQTQWVAYCPDREEIWTNICAQLIKQQHL